VAGSGHPKDGVREEFLAEAQEIIESLSRDLLVLDQSQKDGRVDPDLINEVFRGVHTLKGIAGMFGYHQLGALAHALEDLLDDLRLGRVDLSADVLDVLFEGVENFQRLLGGDADGDATVSLDAFAASIERVSGGQSLRTPVDPLASYELDSSVLSVLTEYEEHRLRTNVIQGLTLFRLRVRFSLTSIDSSLEDLKSRTKGIAEIITYLPSMDGGEGDHIDLDVLMASRVTLDALREAISDDSAQLAEVMRKRDARTPIPPPPNAKVPAKASGGVAAGAHGDGFSPAAPLRPEGAGADPAARDLGADQLSLRSVANTVRVDIGKLDHLMNVVGELAIVRSAVARLTEKIRGRPELRQLAIELHRVNRGFERHLEELQDGILDVRMVPLGQVFDKLARIVRQVAREHGKEVRLVVTGADTEVDKLIVEELSDPLMHIIRNAIDHGLEAPKVRELAGKPPVGTLALNAYQKGNHVLIEVEDDGAGMNDQLLREVAVKKGVMSKEVAEEMSREEAFNLIFAAGFSTRSAITDLSGRGVGMDVVKTNIARLGGVIDVQSEVGIGTKFTITLPVTLAIISALLVRVRDRHYAVPITSVQEAIMLDPAAVRTVEGREVLTLRGATLPLCRLDVVFGLSHHSEPEAKQYIVVSSVGHRRMGFVVDGLHGQQDIVIKSLGKSLADVRGFAGATDLGDQRVALVLDAPGLLEEMLSTGEWSFAAGMRP
jgi:two-component system, chemotaxis family, sensor kinase CheA